MRLIDADEILDVLIHKRVDTQTMYALDAFIDGELTGLGWAIEAVKAQPTAGPVSAAPRVVTLDELINGAGVGYEENWLKGEDGEEDSFEVNRCAWCNGSVVLNDSEYVSSKLLERHYNKPYGLRVWSGMPSAGQREATPWAGD